MSNPQLLPRLVLIWLICVIVNIGACTGVELMSGYKVQLVDIVLLALMEIVLGLSLYIAAIYALDVIMTYRRKHAAEAKLWVSVAAAIGVTAVILLVSLSITLGRANHENWWILPVHLVGAVALGWSYHLLVARPIERMESESS